MHNAVDVTPGKWTDIKVLFDDGEYSIISGVYDDSRIRCLGERWNGESRTHGFPSQGKNPTWYVTPMFLTIPILHGILDELRRKPNKENRSYEKAVLQELSHQLAQKLIV